jgi:GNAT superfamily N-acetyltransferase
MAHSPSIDAYNIRQLSQVTDGEIQQLAELLVDCVEGGASIGFMHPLPMAKAVDFWRRVAETVTTGRRALLVAVDPQGIAGTVHLVLGQPDNQPHRADVSKMLVHSRARRRGLGAALMRAAEQTARDCGKTLLVLDTVTGSDADRLYTRLGWQRVGEIPGFALMPGGELAPATYFYRVVSP